MIKGSSDFMEGNSFMKNPSFMKCILSTKLNARVRSNDILVTARKSANFEDKSLATLRPKICNALPQNIKAENSYVKLRNILQHGLDLNANVT